jgi:hypothetical protein
MTDVVVHFPSRTKSANWGFYTPVITWKTHHGGPPPLFILLGMVGTNHLTRNISGIIYNNITTFDWHGPAR